MSLASLRRRSFGILAVVAAFTGVLGYTLRDLVNFVNHEWNESYEPSHPLPMPMHSPGGEYDNIYEHEGKSPNAQLNYQKGIRDGSLRHQLYHAEALIRGVFQSPEELLSTVEPAMQAGADPVWAFELTNEAALRGDIKAQLVVAKCYGYGVGIPQNPQKSFTWALSAAHAGNVEAQAIVGADYFDGWGVNQNFPEALKWAWRAAQRRQSLAEFTVASAYKNAEGVNQDFEKAYYWFWRSARDGEPSAFVEMAACHAEGKCGQPRDVETAISELKIAIAKNYAPAESALGGLYLDHHELPEALQQSRYWLERGARHGDTKAMEWLGDEFSTGVFYKLDIDEAISWYELASRVDDLNAEKQLSLLYSERLKPPDYRKAIFWYEKWAGEGDTETQHFIGDRYLYGWGEPNSGRNVRPNPLKALKWYHISASHGDTYAECQLAVMYGRGMGIDQNYQKAIAWTEAMQKSLVSSQDPHTPEWAALAAYASRGEMVKVKAILDHLDCKLVNDTAAAYPSVLDHIRPQSSN